MQDKISFQLKIGNNLRRIRLQKKMTVEKLALEAGLSYSQVIRIELGKINTTAYTLKLIADVLNVHLSAIFEI